MIASIIVYVAAQSSRQIFQPLPKSSTPVAQHGADRSPHHGQHSYDNSSSSSSTTTTTNGNNNDDNYYYDYYN